MLVAISVVATNEGSAKPGRRRRVSYRRATMQLANDCMQENKVSACRLVPQCMPQA